jgi:hypothetical protein
MSDNVVYDSPFELNPTFERNILDTHASTGLIRSKKFKLSPYQTKDYPVFKKYKKKKPWADFETMILKKGMETFGNDWCAIKSFYPDVFLERTNVDLKDRARNVKRKLEREKKHLGIWGFASR